MAQNAKKKKSDAKKTCLPPYKKKVLSDRGVRNILCSALM